MFEIVLGIIGILVILKIVNSVVSTVIKTGFFLLGLGLVFIGIYGFGNFFGFVESKTIADFLKEFLS